MDVEKNQGKSKGIRELIVGTGGADRFSRKVSNLDPNLSKVGRALEESLHSWLGWPNADCCFLHLLCAGFYSLFPTAKIMLAARHGTLAGQF